MKKYFQIILCFPIALIMSCGVKKETKSEIPFQIIPIQIDAETSYRGLSVVDDNTIWVSGSGGKIISSRDGGNTWKSLHIRNTEHLDFRSICAFDSLNAMVLSAGSPAMLYKTKDGGKNWALVYSDYNEDAFYNAMAFWDNAHGIAVGDQKDGIFSILSTNDSGNTWTNISHEVLLGAEKGEAGYAASSSCITLLTGDHVWFGTGGSKSRVLYSNNRGYNWISYSTPFIQGEDGDGIYSIEFKDLFNGVAVGGNYTNPDSCKKAAAFTRDGGKTWIAANTYVGGYRSCVAYVGGTKGTYVCTGTNGVDYSFDGGKTWKLLDTLSYHTVRFTSQSKTGWLFGKGNAAKIELKKNL